MSTILRCSLRETGRANERFGADRRSYPPRTESSGLKIEEGRSDSKRRSESKHALFPNGEERVEVGLIGHAAIAFAVSNRDGGVVSPQ